MRILDLFRGSNKERGELSELKVWLGKMQPFLGQEVERRHRVCAAAVNQAFLVTGEDPNNPIGKAAYRLCQALLAFDAHLYFPVVEMNKPLATAERWELTAAIKRALVLFENQEKLNLLIEALANLVKSLCYSLPPISSPGNEGKLSRAVPLYSFLPDPAATIGIVTRLPFSESLVSAGFFEKLRTRLEYNLYIASRRYSPWSRPQSQEIKIGAGG